MKLSIIFPFCRPKGILKSHLDSFAAQTPSRRLSEGASSKISNLGLIFALMVMLAHANWQFQGDALQDIFRLYWFFIAMAAPPFFFLTSGFFLANRFGDAGWWGSAVRKRFWSLFVPFMAWTVVYFLEMLAVDVVKNLLQGAPPFENLRLFWGSGRIFFGFKLWLYPGLAPCWYVRNLILLVLVSPAIKWLYDRFGVLWIACAALGYGVTLALLDLGIVGFDSRVGGSLSCGFTAVGLFYFSLGIHFHARPHRPLSRRTAACSLCLASLFLALHVCLRQYGINHIYFLGCVSLPFLLAGLWTFLPPRPLPAWLVSCAFPLYVIHPIAYDLYISCLRGGRFFTSCTLSYVVLEFVLSFFLIMGLVLALRRFLPRCAGFLFGGR